MYIPLPHMSDLTALLPELKKLRHDLHQHPELGFQEHRSQALVMSWLTEHGYAPRACAGTGVVADLHPDRPVDLALRADLDALPMQEETVLPYRSVHDGVAHKCGHDGHTAILLGVAKILAASRDMGGANVRLLFQPAEEGVNGGGARVMVAEGALQGVQSVYGLHNWPGFPKGQVHVCAGPVMAQVDNFQIKVLGEGGHASQPHLCRDPIVAAAQMVTALQTVVSRSLSCSESAVLTVGSFQAGRANNVIPSTATLLGTIRSFDAAVRARVHQRLQEVVQSVAAAMGVRAELDLQPEYPVLVNAAHCVEKVEQVAAKVVGAANLSSAGLPMSASEDFAFFAQEIPAAYFFLGAGAETGTTPGCHHPDFDFDDDLLEIGIRMFLGLAGR